MNKEKKSYRSTPRDVFLYLLVIAMLYVSVVSFLTLIFQYVNFLIPDQPFNFGSRYAVMSASSALIVAFPIYILLTWLVNKDLRNDASKIKLSIRRWLIYLTLFIAAVTMIVDLITLINNFYQGEITSAFLIKALAVLLLAAVVFGYYLWDLHRENRKGTLNKIFAIIAGCVMLTVIISGFFVIGTPKDQRAKRLDTERLADLQAIQYEITIFWDQKTTLPESLDELSTNLPGFNLPTDPESQEAYTYNKIDESSFELCANFATIPDKNNQFPERPFLEPLPRKIDGESFVIEPHSWNYKPGLYCFERTITSSTN